MMIPPGTYELERLNKEVKRNIIKESYFVEENYPFLFKPSLSTRGSVSEIKPIFIDTQIVYSPNDNLGDLPGFRSDVLSGKYNLSLNPFEILSIDNIFIETNIARV